VNNEKDSDFKAIFSEDTYSSLEEFSTPRSHSIRAQIEERRIVHLEKKFFCDKTSEKTARMTVSKVDCSGKKTDMMVSWKI
jgi:hypothetical protein